MSILHFELMAIRMLSPEEKMPILASAVELLVDTNLAFMKKYPDTPSLYSTKIRYALLPKEWRDIPTLLVKKFGDCKSLVAYRLAEIRQKGEKARVHIVIQKSKTKVFYHIEIEHSSGRIEDPSRRLGMSDPWTIELQ